MNKTDLLAKLKAAETGSPELSADVFKYLNPDAKWKRSDVLDRDVIICDQFGSFNLPPQLTTSIDAAVNAVESILPEWDLEMNQTIVRDKWYTSLFSRKNKYAYTDPCVHKSLPIAICIALIEATEEK